MQHDEKADRNNEQKGISILSIFVLVAVATMIANIIWIAGNLPGRGKGAPNRGMVATPREPVEEKQKRPALPPLNPVQGAWEWKWQGRSVAVLETNLSSARNQQQQAVTGNNTLLLKVQLLPGEEPTGVKGNFVYDGITARQKITTKVRPDKGSKAFLINITVPAPKHEPEKVSFNLDLLEISSYKPAKFTIDWKRYRTMPTDAEGRTLINLGDQQPNKIFNGELRLTHLYYGNSSIYLSAEQPTRRKAPYLYPTNVYPAGVVVTNEKGETAPSIQVSPVALVEGLSSTALQLGRNNFTDQATSLNVQVAKVRANLVIGANLVVQLNKTRNKVPG